MAVRILPNGTFNAFVEKSNFLEAVHRGQRLQTARAICPNVRDIGKQIEPYGGRVTIRVSKD